ncbi:hypothetical protein IMZ48_05010 [Candidatus Bathyarchaeota archaeon]|nr:hypothetical protein [Candidatus Bathyarchaeota archaeon]
MDIIGMDDVGPEEVFIPARDAREVVFRTLGRLVHEAFNSLDVLMALMFA